MVAEKSCHNSVPLGVKVDRLSEMPIIVDESLLLAARVVKYGALVASIYT